MRAIDADALKEELCKEYRHFDQRIKISPVFKLIRDAPTIEPESNCFGCKHVGMWENEIEYGYPSPCTRCKRRVNDNYER